MPKSVTPIESTEKRLKRCAYFNKRGYRCSITLPPGGDSAYCSMHAASLEKRERAEARKLAVELFDNCADLASLEDVQLVLKRLLHFIALGRIPDRKASLLLATTRTLIRTFTLIDAASSHGSGHDSPPPKIIWSWDLPKDHPNAGNNAHSNESAESESSGTQHSGSPQPALSSYPESPSNESPDPVPPHDHQQDRPAGPTSPAPTPPAFPSKPQTEFPLNEHPWGPSAARPAIRRYGPKYRGF